MTNQVAKILKEQGWVTRTEFCKLIGRENGGNITPLAKKCGVNFVSAGKNGNGDIFMFRPEDARKIPPVSQEKDLPGGSHNGGKLMGEIAQLRKRIEQLEKFKRSFE